MSQQNIYQYNFKKWYVKPSSQFFDISLASDEIDFNEEVVFSTKLIGQDNGNVLPIYFDLNNSGSSQMVSLSYGDFVSGNTLVSLNYYNPNNENISCFTSSTLCDIGLTGIDNGLVPNFSGETIQFTMGLYTGGTKWDRYSFDRRTKLIPITSYTNTPVNLSLSAEYEPGSVIANYFLLSDLVLDETVTVSFTNILGLSDGTSILITTGVTINSGNFSGNSEVILNENFNNLTRVSAFSGITSNSNGSEYNFDITQNAIFPTPTPTTTQTPTITDTLTPTPTNTLSNTPTSSQTPNTTNTPTKTITQTITATNNTTPTPSITPSMTQTSTPTNTVTPTPTNSVNYQTPTPTTTQTVTNTVTLSFTPTNTTTNTITPTVTRSQTVTPSITRTQTVTPSFTPTNTTTPTVTPTTINYGSDPIYNLLSATGKTAYTAATVDNFFSVSQSDYYNIMTGLTATTTYLIPTDVFLTGSTLSQFAGGWSIIDGGQSGITSGNYVMGYAVRPGRASTSQSLRLISGGTINGTYTYLGSGNNTFTSSSVQYTPVYFLRKSPTTPTSGASTYIGIYTQDNLCYITSTSTRTTYYASALGPGWISNTFAQMAFQVLVNNNKTW